MGRRPGDETVTAFAKSLDQPEKTVRFNPADGISLVEAEVIALVYNPDLRLARLKAGIAKAEANYAGRWEDPELGADVLEVTDKVPEPWVIGSSLSLTIPLSGRLAVEKKRAKAEVRAKLAALAEAEWETRMQLRKAWFEWSAHGLRLEQTQAIAASLEAVSESTSKLAESGEMPRIESTLFTIERASREAEIGKLRGKLRESEQTIRSLMGMAPEILLPLRASMATRTRAKTGKLEKDNLKLIRLREEYLVAELKLWREIRKQYPDLQLGPQFEEEQGVSKYGAFAAIPLPIFNSNRGGIAKARAERELSRAAYETELERKLGQLAAKQSKLEASRKHRIRLSHEVVPLVERQVEDARRLLELGEGSGMILLESLMRSHETILHLIEARLEENLARIEILHLQGPAS